MPKIYKILCKGCEKYSVASSLPVNPSVPLVCPVCNDTSSIKIISSETFADVYAIFLDKKKEFSQKEEWYQLNDVLLFHRKTLLADTVFC